MATRVVAKVFVGSAVISTIVDQLYEDPGAGWIYVLCFAALAAAGAVAFGSLVIGARLRDVAAPDARLDSLVQELLPRTGIDVALRVNVGSIRGLEPGGATWGLRRPRVLIEAQWAQRLPSPALSGLLAHEVAHAVRRHVPRALLRYALLVVTVSLGTVAAASDSTLRGWANAGPVADVRTAPLAVAAGGLLLLLMRAVELVSSRHQEAEADRLALQWTPDGAGAFLAHFAAIHRLPPRWTLRERLLSAQHPDTVDRLAGRTVAECALPVDTSRSQSTYPAPTTD